MAKEVILTGIRSNEEPHLGNYLGAMLPMVKLQQQKAGDYQINMFVPDLHSFTTPVDHRILYSNTIKNLKYYIAAGLDINNEDTYIYRQSYIPAHSELFTILNNFAYFGELSRMTEFKDKTKAQENVTSGLFTYPVLMAADILLYNAKWVPVGEDQRQHLELTRTLAERFNNRFGNIFVVPEESQKQAEFAGLNNALRIRSLRNPDKKMSKSVSDPAGTILLSDSPSEAAKKIMSATTDSYGEIAYDIKDRPGISNLLQIFALLTNQDLNSVVTKWQGNNSYGDLKKEVASVVEQFLHDFQNKFINVNSDQLLNKLEQSELAMSKIADLQLHKVQNAIGLRPNS